MNKAELPHPVDMRFPHFVALMLVPGINYAMTSKMQCQKGMGKWDVATRLQKVHVSIKVSSSPRDGRGDFCNTGFAQQYSTI